MEVEPGAALTGKSVVEEELAIHQLSVNKEFWEKQRPLTVKHVAGGEQTIKLVSVWGSFVSSRTASLHNFFAWWMWVGNVASCPLLFENIFILEANCPQPSCNTNRHFSLPSTVFTLNSSHWHLHLFSNYSSSSNRKQNAPNMASRSTSSLCTAALLLIMVVSWATSASARNFYQDFDITWGDGRAQILNNGDLLTLSLDKASGSGFQSKNEYLFGKIDMQLKLVPGNSAGTVTAYYLSSNGSTWDEIDFEFLGNLSGDPYILHTNVFSQGKGNREQQFYLWFDPTADFHTYSILWNPQRIIFSVDGTPIREFKNAESIGVPFPKAQPMRIFSSLWNADDWATRGGLVKTDWTQAPFTASYRNFNADNACVWSSGSSSCTSSSSSSDGNAWLSEELDSTSQERLKWVQSNYMIYNYCSDAKRFPQGFPPECTMS
ncbi:hypothetical protein EUGRSUZ_C00176 [Eucalyptus grandis]|uniref:Uncharacterized protein n=3 Tax=Eucalyptus grandis TaxID=71139 RepID=A0ACC3L8Y9_EUCGR|nr:hypothetical protein EUGRSUZ_C00176 [Eucalyptus grandis]